MGSYLSVYRTHTSVPAEVKQAVPPIDYVPARPEEMETNKPFCEDCGDYFGWFVKPTNCNWCGAMRCRRCCPNRHLLGDKPGCATCTQTAFRLRRSQMLRSHYERVGIQQPVPAVALPPNLCGRVNVMVQGAVPVSSPSSEPYDPSVTAIALDTPVERDGVVMDNRV